MQKTTKKHEKTLKIPPKIDPGGLRRPLKSLPGGRREPNRAGSPTWGPIFAKKRPRSKHSSFLAPKINLAIMEREARSTREPQALQATENTRREARTARRTRAKDHEEQQSKRGASNASIKIASVVDRVGPCSAAARPRRAVRAGNVSRTCLRFLFGLSVPITANM